jgi:hypothetical protein
MGVNEVPIDAGLPHTSLVTRLPLVAGYRYSGKFSGYKYRVRDVDLGVPYLSRHGRTYEFAVGQASREMFDQILGSMFQRLVRIDDSTNRSSVQTRVDLVFEPNIKMFNFDFGGTSFRAMINYEVNLLSPDGNLIASYDVRGEGVAEARFEDDRPLFGEITKSALRQAAASFIAGFDKNANLTKWLAEKGVGN